MAKSKENTGTIVTGTIESAKIKEAHIKIRKVAESFKDTNFEVSRITRTVKQNWVGLGRTEFDSQYRMLISKIDDFGDTLKDIYEALVQAEAEYTTVDDGLRQELVMAIKD